MRDWFLSTGSSLLTAKMFDWQRHYPRSSQFLMNVLYQMVCCKKINSVCFPSRRNSRKTSIIKTDGNSISCVRDKLSDLSVREAVTVKLVPQVAQQKHWTLITEFVICIHPRQITKQSYSFVSRVSGFLFKPRNCSLSAAEYCLLPLILQVRRNKSSHILNSQHDLLADIGSPTRTVSKPWKRR